MKTGLKNYQEKLQAEHRALEQAVEKYRSEGDIQRQLRFVKEIFDGKIQNTKPEIMVYGIYNAGKSSILNELMGEDRARVADVPTTDSVDYYEWNGYRIADTPGVAAPIDHENVTQEHLRKADIVIFVMSTTGSNERKENYVRMKDIADAGKKIIIVLNDKNGDLGKNDEAIRQIKVKVAENMRTVGIQNVEERYVIVTVNAARAKKGRLEGKAQLVLKSNMNELGQVVQTELKQTDSYDVLYQSVGQIDGAVQEIIRLVESKTSAAMGKDMNQILTMIREAKRNFREELQGYIEEKATRFGDNLCVEIWARRENENEINAYVTQEVKKLEDVVNRQAESILRDHIDGLNFEVRDFADRFSNKNRLESKRIAVSKVFGGAEKGENAAEETGDMMDDLRAVLAQLDEMKGSGSLFSKVGTGAFGNLEKAAAALGEDGVKDVVKNAAAGTAGTIALTAAGEAVASGIAGKFLGNMASSVVPLIGPAVAAVTTLKTVYDLTIGGNERERRRAAEAAAQQNRAEEQRLAALRQAQQELGQRCRYMAAEYADELKLAMATIATAVFAEYERPIREEFKRYQDADGDRMRAAAELRDLSGRLIQLQSELK